jgi:NADP-dependent 3-hydroxy acid dehydrogenase YdfG
MCDDLAEIDLDQVENTFQSNIIQMFAITKFSLPHMDKGDSYVLTTRYEWKWMADGPLCV